MYSMKYVLPFSLLKAKDYSNLIQTKVQDKNGNLVTRWVSPEDAKQKKMFDDKTDGHGGEEGYFEEVRNKTHKYQVTPLVEKAKKINPVLGKRLETKYANYQFDQDTMDLDVKLDLETVKHLMDVKKYPDQWEVVQEDYDKATLKLAQQINNRKKAMLKLKTGMTVQTVKGQGVIKEFSRRGFPVVSVGNETIPFFVDEVKVG